MAPSVGIVLFLRRLATLTDGSSLKICANVLVLFGAMMKTSQKIEWQAWLHS